jgi:tetratricopeptide (TPR) repeat protein
VVLCHTIGNERAQAADSGGFGLDSYDVSNAELALLPSFCRHTQVIMQRHGSLAEHQRWIARVGEPFKAMHHYCISVVALMRSDRAGVPVQQRRYLHNYAVANLTFVVKNSTPDFVFLPEVLFRRGQAHKKLKELDEAIRDLRQAVEMRPDYVFAVSELADAYASRGKKKEAREVLEKGLQHSPDSKFLRQSLDAMR